jgi:hypothetical protein
MEEKIDKRFNEVMDLNNKNFRRNDYFNKAELDTTRSIQSKFHSTLSG